MKHLLDKNVFITLVTTGGGARAQGLLWDTPGASSFLSSSSFPYAQEESEAFVGRSLSKLACRETAMLLAMAAFMRSCETLELRMRRLETSPPIDEEKAAQLLKLGARQPIGVALTSVVATSREHRGEHRIHAAAITPNQAFTVDLVIPKGVGAEDRLADGALCDSIAIDMINCAVGHGIGSKRAWQPDGVLRDLDDQTLKYWLLQNPYFSAGGQWLPAINGNQYNLVPVTANPLHEGHVGMAQRVEERTGIRSIFLITTRAPPSNGVYKKPEPTTQEVLRRVAMVQASNRLYGAERGVYLSQRTLFVSIAEQHGGGLVVGADALQRALDPQWLGGAEATRAQFLRLKDFGAYFLVFDRPPITGEQVVNDAVQLFGARDAWTLIRPVKGTWATSSTDLRKLRGW